MTERNSTARNPPQKHQLDVMVKASSGLGELGAVVKAVMKGRAERVVSLLFLEHGDPNELYETVTPLYCAASNGDANMIQMLLTYGALADDDYRAPRRIALHAAARY